MASRKFKSVSSGVQSTNRFIIPREFISSPSSAGVAPDLRASKNALLPVAQRDGGGNERGPRTPLENLDKLTATQMRDKAQGYSTSGVLASAIPVIGGVISASQNITAAQLRDAADFEDSKKGKNPIQGPSQPVRDRTPVGGFVQAGLGLHKGTTLGGFVEDPTGIPSAIGGAIQSAQRSLLGQAAIETRAITGATTGRVGKAGVERVATSSERRNEASDLAFDNEIKETLRQQKQAVQDQTIRDKEGNGDGDTGGGIGRQGGGGAETDFSDDQGRNE